MYDASSEEDVIVTLTDVTGKLLQSKHIKSVVGNNTMTLDLSNYTSGVYFISIECSSKTISNKFIKE